METEDLWCADAGSVLAFGQLLDELGAFEERSDVFAYFEKPWKWTPERTRWIELGGPEAFEITLERLESDSEVDT